MPRLAGVDLPNDKRIDIALTYIYGIGKKVSQDVLAQAKIQPKIKAKDLTSEELKTIQSIIDTVANEGELRRAVRNNIELLKRIQSYRGMRHSMGLPVRGQRTKTNARTRKGKRRTIGALSKEMAAKMESGKPAATKK